VHPMPLSNSVALRRIMRVRGLGPKKRRARTKLLSHMDWGFADTSSSSKIKSGKVLESL
jgi:hypothetical protein